MGNPCALAKLLDVTNLFDVAQLFVVVTMFEVATLFDSAKLFPVAQLLEVLNSFYMVIWFAVVMIVIADKRIFFVCGCSIEGDIFG